MAETIHLKLKGSKQGDIKGESSQTSLDRADSIECIYYEQGVGSARDASSGMATGRRQYDPLIIHKRIDKASPLIAQALVTNEVVNGVFTFYRPHPGGDGTTEQFYTVEIKNARINSIKQCSPNTTDPETTHLQPYEEITFVFNTITLTHNTGKTQSQDTWSSNQ